MSVTLRQPASLSEYLVAGMSYHPDLLSDPAMSASECLRVLACGQAWGPNADSHRKLLKLLVRWLIKLTLNNTQEVTERVGVGTGRPREGLQGRGRIALRDQLHGGTTLAGSCLPFAFATQPSTPMAPTT